MHAKKMNLSNSDSANVVSSGTSSSEPVAAHAGTPERLAGVGDSELQIAAESGSLEKVKQLLAQKVDVNHRNHNAETVLHTILRRSSVSGAYPLRSLMLVETVLKTGLVDSTLKDMSGKTALDLVNADIKQGNSGFVEKDIRTLLELAVESKPPPTADNIPQQLAQPAHINAPSTSPPLAVVNTAPLPIPPEDCPPVTAPLPIVRTASLRQLLKAHLPDHRPVPYRQSSPRTPGTTRQPLRVQRSLNPPRTPPLDPADQDKVVTVVKARPSPRGGEAAALLRENAALKKQNAALRLEVNRFKSVLLALTSAKRNLKGLQSFLSQFEEIERTSSDSYGNDRTASARL